MSEEETYQRKMRAAAVGAVVEADLIAVVQGIVQRAKDGDKVAIDQLFNQLLGVNAKPTHVTNNLVVQDVEAGARLAKRANGHRRLPVDS